MPSNHTENYQLSQWVKSDQVKMEDFNADNAKIDTALKAETDARATEDSSIRTDMNSALATKGNCQIWTTSYTGNGLFGQDHPKQLTFPSMPLAALIFDSTGNILSIPLVSGTVRTTNLESHVIVQWSGTTASWYSVYADTQMNYKNIRYTVIAFYARG